MPEKIIVCSPQLGISPNSNLGGEVYDREIIEGLCHLGIEVIVILPKNKLYTPCKNLKVYYLPFKHIWPPILFNILIIPYLFSIYKKHKFNVLRVHSPYFVGLGGLIFKFFNKKVPLIVIYHHLEDRFFYKLINKIFINYWDRIITVSNFTKRELTKNYNLGRDKVKVIYNGVDKIFKPGLKNKGLVKKYNLKGKKVLLYLGQINKRKNILFLLELIKNLNYPKFVLLICGDGKQKKELEKKSEDWGLGNKIIFTGFILENKKADYYNLGDVFLYPSKLEGFGLSVLEAAACQKALVVSDKGSLPEIVVDNQTGLIARFNDLVDWQLKVEKLLKNYQLRKKLGLQAEKFSKMFSWERSAKENIKIFKKLI